MTTTKRILIAAGGAAVTFALLYFACQQIQALTDFPSGFALIPFYLIFPAYVVAEVLGSRAAFLMTGFLEFFLLWWLALLAWGRMQPRERSRPTGPTSSKQPPMNLTSKSRALVLAGLGYGVSLAFLGWEELTVTITAPDPIARSVVWGPLVPFTLAAVAALLAPSPRWSAAVTTLIVLLLGAGAYLSFRETRDEYFIFPYVFALMVEAAVSLIFLVAVSIARIVVNLRSHAVLAA